MRIEAYDMTVAALLARQNAPSASLAHQSGVPQSFLTLLPLTVPRRIWRSVVADEVSVRIIPLSEKR